MIVICTKCEAKFRVADERVGARGAKVRCSRCQNVFLVEPLAGAAPASSEPLPVPVQAASRGTENPFAVNPVRAGAPTAAMRPPPLPPPLPSRGAPASPSPTPAPAGADPFASFAAAAPSPDPFDPPAAGDDPSRVDDGPPLPVTDLSDLLGHAARAAGSLAAAGPAPAQAPAPAPPAPSAPKSSAPFGEDDLALEDRLTPPPVAVRGASGHADPFLSGGGDAFDPAAFDLGGGADDAGLALGSGPAPATASSHDADAPPATQRAVAVPAPAPSRPVAPEPDARIPGARGSRLRAAIVNAVALAALLAAAVAILVVWRAEGRLDASLLRPSALVAGLRRAGAPGPFVTRAVRSGLYEREKGPPVLFVRGDVVSRAPAPVRGVTIRVEVLRSGQVIASGEARAGAVPTAEELHRAADTTALAAMAAAAAARAPARVAPGDEVPFLVAIADHPADLEGASLRLVVREAEGAAP
jgi:predicted Zn finger-like uncharacterized protein